MIATTTINSVFYFGAQPLAFIPSSTAQVNLERLCGNSIIFTIDFQSAVNFDSHDFFISFNFGNFSSDLGSNLE